MVFELFHLAINAAELFSFLSCLRVTLPTKADAATVHKSVGRLVTRVKGAPAAQQEGMLRKRFQYPSRNRSSQFDVSPYKAAIEAAFTNSSSSQSVPFPFTVSVVLAICSYWKLHQLSEASLAEAVARLSKCRLQDMEARPVHQLAVQFERVYEKGQRYLRTSQARKGSAEIEEYLKQTVEISPQVLAPFAIDSPSSSPSSSASTTSSLASSPSSSSSIDSKPNEVRHAIFSALQAFGGITPESRRKTAVVASSVNAAASFWTGDAEDGYAAVLSSRFKRPLESTIDEHYSTPQSLPKTHTLSVLLDVSLTQRQYKQLSKHASHRWVEDEDGGQWEEEPSWSKWASYHATSNEFHNTDLGEVSDIHINHKHTLMQTFRPPFADYRVQRWSMCKGTDSADDQSASAEPPHELHHPLA